MKKVTFEFNGSRNLHVHFAGQSLSSKFRLQATSESENIKDSRRKVSKTWNFEEDGMMYRVQVQTTEIFVTEAGGRE